ncbi:MAG: carbohydrate ABC transporter permease [Aestuariivirga sp.]|uniref:carbohydrate ABC transporter permease n=1 Tax=Aestuariivirga sp. TaxID=2650926 RepID=UPI00301A4C84
MLQNPALRHLRDIAALLTVGLFMFPLFWWGLNSIKPASAIFENFSVNWFDFTPTLDNYRVTLAGEGPAFFASRQAILDTLLVAMGATLLTLATALPAAFALSLIHFTSRRAVFLWVLFHRILPPIAILVPLVFTYSQVGLRDTRAGVILAHAAVNLPFAILLLKSFFDDVPREVGEAATIDGATRFTCFTRIYVPLVKGGIAASAVLCFIFSWTEFLMALFLTNSIRLLPVQLSLVVTQTWGFTSALSTASILPAFLFVLLVQRHLVRGLTMGLTKG